MARYNHLPIYKESYELLIKIMELVKNYPKDYKFTIGEKMQNHALELIVDIYKANSATDKIMYIKSIQEHVQFIGLFLRISMDIKIINELRYGEFVEKICSIEKQSTAWAKVC